MHAFRLRAYLLLIVMVLVLSACASVPVSEMPESTHVFIQYTPVLSSTVLPVEKVDLALNPVRLDHTRY